MATAVAPPAPSPASSAPPATSAPGVPVAGGFEANIDAVIGRSLSSPSDDNGGSSEPAELPEVVVDDTETVPVVDDVEVLDEPEVAVAPKVTEEAPENVDHLAEITPDSIANGKYHTTKAKWDRLTAADKAMNELRTLDPGITVDTIREMHATNLQVQEMLAGFDSGDPKGMGVAVATFAGVGPDGRPNLNPQSVSAFADQLIASTARNYPTAFKNVESKMLMGRAQQQWAKYQQTGLEADKFLAWNLEYMVRGDAGDYGKYKAPATPQNGQQQNPLAAERAALAREKQSYEFRVNQDRQQQTANAVSAAEAEAKSVLDQSVDSALSVIPTKVRESKAAEFKHAIRDLREAYEEQTKANPSYQQTRNTLLLQLRASPTPEARSALVAFEKKWADWIIGRAKSEVTSRFTNGVVAQAAAANLKQEKLQERREPGGNGGSPVARATLKQVLGNPKTKFDSGLDTYFNVLRQR